MLTGFLFPKESPAYSRDALKGSHFSITNPVPEEGVLESGVFWEGQFISRDWIALFSCPGTWHFNNPWCLIISCFHVTHSAANNEDRKSPHHSAALSSLYPAGCWSVWPVTFQWPVGSSVSFSVEIRGWQRTWNSACVLPGTACLLPESRGVSW